MPEALKDNRDKCHHSCLQGSYNVKRVIIYVECGKCMKGGTKKICRRFGKCRTTFCQGDWRSLCGKVLDLGLKGWLDMSSRIWEKKGNNASWDDSLANGGCELMDVSSFLTSYSPDTYIIKLLRWSMGSSNTGN